jgi:hypothetical protein
MTPRWDDEHNVFADIIIAVILGWFLWILLIGLAHAHDQNRPDLDKWFDGLAAGGLLCCHGKDYKELDDSDWDTKEAHYRVRLNGKWYDVPENAVVKQKNLVGHALVWVALSYNTQTMTIRCFLPGTWS